MEFLTDELYDAFVLRLERLSNEDLTDYTEVMGRLIDLDDFKLSFFIDDGILIYDLLRDECVRRISLLALSNKPDRLLNRQET